RLRDGGPPGGERLQLGGKLRVERRLWLQLRGGSVEPPGVDSDAAARALQRPRHPRSVRDRRLSCPRRPQRGGLTHEQGFTAKDAKDAKKGFTVKHAKNAKNGIFREGREEHQGTGSPEPQPCPFKRMS